MIPVPEVFRVTSSLSRASKAAVDRALQPYGVHAGQEFILGALWTQDGLTVGALSDHVHVELPTITRAVQRMERQGLVRRVVHPSDGRRVQVWLTPQGKSLETVLPQVLEAVAENMWRHFTAEEREATLVLLSRLRANMGE